MREVAIGKSRATLLVGDNREWLLGVSYRTAVVLWFKRDGCWYRTWLRHCNHSRTTVQHKSRLIKAARDEVGTGIDRAHDCEFSVFMNGVDEWRELGLFNRAESDAEFIDRSFNEHGGGWLRCVGW